MLAREHGGSWLVNERRAYADHFVGGHAHAHAGFANEHAARVLPAGHAAGHGLGEVRIIAGVIAGGAVILNGDVLRLEMRAQSFFERIAAMIRADGEGVIFFY